MRTFLRYGLGVCLWIVGFMGVVGTLATLVTAKRDGFQEPLLAFAIFGGGWGLLYLLYRYIGNRWYDMMDTTRTLITLVCFAIFAILGWYARKSLGVGLILTSRPWVEPMSSEAMHSPSFWPEPAPAKAVGMAGSRTWDPEIVRRQSASMQLESVIPCTG